MICPECKQKTRRRRVSLYHYVESGLSNVYLADIDVIECEKCKRQTPIIPSVLNLHSKIAESIALKPVRLTGEEVRFLRKHLGLTAIQWARHLKVKKSTLSRWEGDKQAIGPSTDLLIRYLYFRVLEERERRHVQTELVRPITDVDEHSSKKLGVRIPASNPSQYQFQDVKTLATAA